MLPTDTMPSMVGALVGSLGALAAGSLVAGSGTPPGAEVVPGAEFAALEEGSIAGLASKVTAFSSLPGDWAAERLSRTNIPASSDRRGSELSGDGGAIDVGLESLSGLKPIRGSIWRLNEGLRK